MAIAWVCTEPLEYFFDLLPNMEANVGLMACFFYNCLKFGFPAFLSDIYNVNLDFSQSAEPA